MGGTSTVYDVKIKYAMQGNAKQGLDGVAASADKAAKNTMSLKGALAAVGAGMLLGKAKSALIDFNSEIQSMKINMSTIMQMQLKMPFEKANKEADKLFNTFQELAKKSPATTKDFMEMAQAIAAPVAMLGGGPDKLAKLTQGAIIAGQAFGERADVVALDIKQMLMGTINSKDRIAQQLISSKGVSQDTFNNKMDGAQRASFLEDVLQADPLKRAADAMGESFKGQVSTFQDMLQIALGQVGKPLMEGLTAEVKRWNQWITEHPKTLARISNQIGGMIKSTFTFVKDAAGWLVDHSDLIMSIAKTFLVFKGAQIGTNIFKNFATGITGLVGQMKSAGSSVVGMISGAGGATVGGAFKGLVGMLSGVGGVIPALGLLVGAIDIVTTLLNTHAEADKKGKAAAVSMSEAVGEVPGLMDRRKELKARLANPMFAGSHEQDAAELSTTTNKLTDPATLGMALRKLDEAAKAHGTTGLKDLDLAGWQKADRHLPDTYDHRDPAASGKMAGEAIKTLEFFNRLSVDARREVLKNAFPERWGDPTAKVDTEDKTKWINTPTKGDTNITIQKIEVASDDPDRFVHGIVSAAEQITNNPTQAQSVIAGGF